jgi:antitoxin MazE
MQVAKWRNSLAVRLPSAVVEALQIREGDEIEIHVAGARQFGVARTPRAGRIAETSTCLPRSAPCRFQVRQGRGKCPVVFTTPISSSTSHPAIRRKPIGQRLRSPTAALCVPVLNELANVARRKMLLDDGLRIVNPFGDAR